MAGTALVVYAGLIALATAAAWVWSRRSRSGPTLRLESEPLTRAVRSARRRFFASLGLTSAVMAIGFAGSLVFPATLGLPLVIAPAAAGAAGLLLYALTPPASAEGFPSEVRVAALEPRHTWSFAPARTLAGLAVLFGAVLVLLVCAAVASSPDEAGRYRAITLTGDGIRSSATPYPGWFYALPLIAVIVLLAVAVLVALRRIATTPSLPGAGLERHDRAWRAASTRIVTSLAAAAVTLQAGGAAVIGGNAIRIAASQPSVPAAAQIIGAGLLLTGLAVLCASAVAYTLAVLRIFSLPGAIARRVVDDAAAGSEASR